MWPIFSTLGNFFKLRWKPVLIIVIAIGLGVSIWSWKSDIIEKTRALAGYEQVQQTLKEQKQELNKLIEENKRVRRINEKYREKIKEIRQSRTEILYEIKELKKSNKEVRSWANNRIPQPVLDDLRGKKSKRSDQEGNKTNSSTQTMDSNSSSSKVERRH